jgi:hypothetical protein
MRLRDRAEDSLDRTPRTSVCWRACKINYQKTVDVAHYLKAFSGDMIALEETTYDEDGKIWAELPGTSRRQTGHESHD